MNVNVYPEGWRDIVEDYDKDNLCTSNDIALIRQKSQLLCLSYIYALRSMNNWQYCDDCCVQAIKDLNQVGICATTNKQVLLRWNREFRSRERFPSPRKRKEAKPIIVQLFPEVEERINEFCSENIGELTIEKCQEYVNYTVLPNMHVTYHDMEHDSCKWKLLNRNLTRPPSLTTIWR